jgi:hypothetical protein
MVWLFGRESKPLITWNGVAFKKGDRIVIRKKAGVKDEDQTGFSVSVQSGPGQRGTVVKRWRPDRDVLVVFWDAQEWQEAEGPRRFLLPAFEDDGIHVDYLAHENSGSVAPDIPRLTAPPVGLRRPQKGVTARHARISPEADPVTDLLRTCQQAPHQGLAIIDRLSPELRNRPSICFGKFIALRTLALKDVIGSVNLAGVETAELARLLNKQSVTHAVQSLHQISEIERLYPGYIINLGTPDDPFGEQAVDDICIVVERLFPGRVHGTLGWTKIFYFGIDRIGFVRGLKDQIPNELLTKLLRTRFLIDETALSAVAMNRGSHSNGIDYVDFLLCGLIYGETPTIGDAEVLGTLRISGDSRFLFTRDDDA